MDQEPFVTLDDIVRRYSVKRTTASEWMRRGLITGHRIGGRWYTTWDAVFSFEGRLCAPQGSTRKAAKRPLQTVGDLSIRFSVAETTIRDWLRKGELPGIRIQETWYVAPDDLERKSGLDRLGQRKATVYDGNSHRFPAGTETAQ